VKFSILDIYNLLKVYNKPWN